MTSSSSPKLYVLLIMLLGLVGGYIIYSQWIKPLEAVIPAPKVNNQNSLAKFKDLDFKILDNSVYKGFITSGESPVSYDKPAKKDLFAP